MPTFVNENEETCPNWDFENKKLNESYTAFNDLPPITNHPSYGSKDFNKTCFNICETKSDDEIEKIQYIENSICRDCPILDDNERDGSEGQNNPLSGTVQYLKNAGLYGMCNNAPGASDPGTDNIPSWYSRQQDANLKKQLHDGMDWSDARYNEQSHIRQFWKQAQRGMKNSELLRMFGTRIPGTMEYTLSDKYKKDLGLGSSGSTHIDVYDFEKLRNDINRNRGSIVPCNENTKPNWKDENGETYNFQCYDPVSKEYISELSPEGGSHYFGPRDIIPEEAHDFLNTEYTTETEGDTDYDQSAIQHFSQLLSGISGDSTFEACVNDKLNTSDNDSEIQTRIARYESIKEFTTEDIHYLKRKLRKIITIRPNELNECMNALNLGESICTTGVADKTLQIGSLIFSIVGNNKIDLLTADNDEKLKLNKLIDEIGPLIPQAIKNIIHVSKEYEKRICNAPSNTTLLLERLYVDLYDKETRVTLDFNPFLDFSSLLDMDNLKFIKGIVILIIILKLFDMITVLFKKE